MGDKCARAPTLTNVPSHPPTWMTKVLLSMLVDRSFRRNSRMAMTAPAPAAPSRPSEPCRCSGCGARVGRVRRVGVREEEGGCREAGASACEQVAAAVPACAQTRGVRRNPRVRHWGVTLPVTTPGVNPWYLLYSSKIHACRGHHMT